MLNKTCFNIQSINHRAWVPVSLVVQSVLMGCVSVVLQKQEPTLLYGQSAFIYSLIYLTRHQYAATF
jgi:hypothetical protein